MMATLNLFPARAPIGTVTVDGVESSVMMTPEFFRALTDLLNRVGGPTGVSNTTLEVLSSTAENQPVDLTPFADIAIYQTPDQGASIAQALQQIADQAAQLLAESRAMLTETNKAIESLAVQVGYTDPYRVNWERPGTIGSLTKNSGAFTILTASSAFGCNAAAAQTAAASGGAVVATGATNVSPFGYATAAQANAIVTLVNNIRAALVANGIMS